ncbi:efflux RND transporter periplasmic adaptor subunit [Paenibacillus sp. GD4]|uniref:efflux RND transporter periplasmic adaptor subunit n=1 Tax=Paenibacillus sp. GD4 TaxID=3068890 RepID=UPI002796B097|nr:efflux RND transporter periplasmic adaptor subunit [Paenibacillus sp. GD4]MDQ1914153.1 efflux RND transporter periplasmic adaptor subunit [Paenibacillus sp. GD4]
MNPNNHNTLYKSAKIVGSLVLTAALLAGCTKPQGPAAQSQTSQLKQVKVAPIEKKKISEPLEQVADVVSSIQLDVPIKTGGDVVQVLKQRGDMVQKGEVILKLDPTDVLLGIEKAKIGMNGTRQQLAKAQEDLANSKQDLRNGIAKLESTIRETEKNYNKLRNDYDMGLVTKFQVEQMETQLNNLKLDLDSSKQKLETLESTNSLAQLEQGLQTAEVSIREANRTLENLEVKASVNGVITELPVEVGMTLSPGFRAAQIQQLDPIKIKAELTEEAAKLVRGKQQLEFYVPGSTERTKGNVSYLADVMSTQTKSYSLELEVPNADRKLKPGMKVQVLLTEEQDQLVPTVPTLSVVREGGDTFVFVLAGDMVEKRKVELGRLNETFQEVRSGVSEGEQLVISGQHQLKDKEKVQVSQ